MEKRRLHLRLAVMLAAVGIAAYGLGFQRVEGRSTASDQEPAGIPRADLIELASMGIFGELERPAVPFLHGAHVDALDERGKDCSACHPSENDRLSPRFKRLLSSKSTGKSDLMDLYHSNCMACHKEMTAEGLKAGPQEECGHCHRSAFPVRSARQPFGLDKSLHYRHVQSLESKCESCHHQYDEAKKSLIHEKGTEESCRYCHSLETVDNRMSMQLASHVGCIDCHRKRLAQSITAGPADCAGCHDPLEQEAIRRISPVPRMDRKQPDLVYVKKQNRDPATSLDTYLDPKMALVRFDHKHHEEANASCRVCHHSDLTSCNTCHTLAGLEKGDGITLEQAMHQIGTDRSCVGCHGELVRDAQCAGCHVLVSEYQPEDTTGCMKCHNGPPAEALPPAGSSEELVPEAVALDLPKSPTEGFREADIADIPDRVAIKALVETYEGVDLPHRKIIDSIWGRIKDSRLAGISHGDPGTFCRGCHHNSPSSAKPPRCGSCHSKVSDENDLLKPGLMAAYHRQCMSCHSEMKVEKPVSTDCTGCHEKRKG